MGGDIGQGNYAGAVSTMLNEGAALFRDSTASPGSFAKGQWVLVDNGEEKHTRKERASMFWGEGVMFGDMPGESDEHQVTEHVFTVGFVTEPTVGDGEIDVFDLESGNIRRFRIQTVRHAPPDRAAQLEGSEEMQIMKDVILGEEPTADRVAAATPIDPGSEVTYDGKVWNVLESHGTKVRIQCGEATITVDSNKLGRGRTDHSNVWHYDPNQTPEGFDRNTKPGLHRGMWIWVKPREKITSLYPTSEWELGIVRLLSGYQVDGYYAMDGERLVENEANVQIVKHAQDEWLNAHKFFKQFRNEAVVGGHSTRSFNLGQHFPRLCAGVGVQWTPIKLTAGGVEEGHIVEGKTQGELRSHPVESGTAGESARVITDGDPLPLLDASVQADRRWGQKWEAAGRGEPVHIDRLSGSKTSTGTTMMVLALVGVVGCVYFLR